MAATNQTIQPGSKIEIRFSLTLSDDTLVEESGDDLDSFVIGDGFFAEGVEALLLGHAVGDTIEESISAEQNLFGARDSESIQIIPLSKFDDSIQVKPGEIIEFELPSGQALPGRITDVDENVAIVDFNHPLAGRDLIFKAEIISVTND